MRQPIPSVILSRRAKIALAVVAILIVLLILLVKFAGVYVNYLWFGSVGHRNVYGTIFWTKVVLFFVFGIAMALIIGGNLLAAYLIRPPFRPMSPEQQNLQNYALMIEPRRRLVLIGISLIAFVAAGASAQGTWQQWQLFLHGGSFGQKDPQFHLDISFYAFDYPIYRTLLSFGFTAIIFALILSVAVHYLTGAIRLQTPGPKITIAARRQLTILVFVFMALKAAAYWLDRYGLVFSDRSKFTGASYTDVHSVLPAKTILFWITVILAVGVLASIWLKSAVLPAIGFIVLIILSIVISGIYPAIVQKVSVSPNASDKEAPYIGRNITATRDAYGIQTQDASGTTGTVKYVDYSATAKPSPTAVTTTNTTVDNIRILDPTVIGPTFTNFQKIAQPYGFSSKLNVDRYTENGAVHDYVVGVRQLEPTNLSGSLNNWINQYTVYTHGYGFVAAQADEDVTQGEIPYSEGGIPPSGSLDLNLKRPEVYFGQGMNAYSVVGAKGAKQREYDGSGNGSAGRTTYTGKGGVSLSSPLSKLAFAIKYQETNFLLNDAVSAPGARVILNRDPKALVQKLAPFLTLDGAPYPFVDQKTGHIMWMVDGYTTMANFPYSERQSLSDLTGTSLRRDQQDRQINYIRNSVKATVDAYDGTVKLYAWDTKDPILKAWRKILPGLVHSKDTMPQDVLDHVRYPQDLFNTQRALLAQYHISDPVDSYNGKGKWAVPEDPNATVAVDQPAYYVLANAPAATNNTPQFQLTSPMVVNNAQNLAAYISVDSDPGPNYGKLTVLQVPGKSAVQGPSQVSNVFRTEPVISKDITQLGTGQSEVVHGNLLTLPLGNSFLYVEPLYVQSTSASSSSYPTLGRVLVTYGDKVGYGATLDDALTDIQQGRTAGSSLNVTSGGTSTPTTPTTGSSSSSSTAPSSGTPTSATPVAGTLASVVAQLKTANTELSNAYATKDPVKIATAQAKVNQLVTQLIGLKGLPTPSASPSK